VMKEQEFLLTTKNGPEKVMGRGYGKYFYIHGEPRHWTIAHAPTGYMIAFSDSLEKCRRIINELLSIDIDWSSADPHYFSHSPKKIKRQVKDVLARRYER